MDVSVAILYEQLKKEINDATIKAHKEFGLPTFFIVSALKEILCKYEMDSNLELVRDYQSLLASVNEDKEEQ